MAINACLDGVKITVSNMETSLRFYSEILGMEPPKVMDNPASTDLSKFLAKMMGLSELHFREAIFRVKDPPVLIQLMEYLTPAARPQPKNFTWTDVGSVRLVFSVDDTAATYERLKSKGVKFMAPPQMRPPPVGGGNVQGFDPDGVALNFTSRGGAAKKNDNKSRLNGVKITVKDMETSIPFYSDLLGLPPPKTLKSEDNPALTDFLAKMMNLPEFVYRETIFSPKEPPVLIQLMQYLTPAARPQPKNYTWTDVGYVRLVFSVKDTSTAYQELKGKGIRFVAPPALRPPPVSGGNVLALDPDGVPINLRHPGAALRLTAS